MTKKQKKQPKKKDSPKKEEPILTKENFLEMLDTVILTVKPKSKRQAKGKTKTSE